MDSVNLKFLNFKAFLAQIPGISQIYVRAINMCDLKTFFTSLRQYKGKSMDELIKDITTKADLDLAKIPQDMKAKFIGYIEFFREVSEI
jgi:hypothetical protein